jgi:hypothetical protein
VIVALFREYERYAAALGFTPVPSYYETPHDTLCFELSLGEATR